MRTRVQIRALAAMFVLSLVLASAAQSNPPVQIQLPMSPLVIDLSAGEGSAGGSSTASGDVGEHIVSAQITGDTDNVFSLVGSGCAGDSCTYPAGTLLPYQVNVLCATMASGTHVATLVVFGDNGSDSASEALKCIVAGSTDNGQIAFLMPPTAMFGSAGATTSTMPQIGAQGSGSDELTSVHILDDGTHGQAAFQIVDARCNGGMPTATCNYASPLSLPTNVLVQCTVPADTSPRTATLEITGNRTGSGDTADAQLQCQQTVVGPPVLSTSANLDITASVGSGATGMLQVSNAAGGSNSGTLDFTASIQSGSDFAALSCTGGCSVAPSGSTIVDVAFTPEHWGDVTGVLELDSNDTAHDPTLVVLNGHGIGAELGVSTALVDLGTLPLGATGSATVMLHDDGNITLSATVDGASGPIGVSGPVPDPIAAGSDAIVTVSCGSGTPTTDGNGDPTQISQTLTVSAPAAYAGSPATIEVRCEIANTHLQVSPTAFPFGAHRVGDAIPPMTLTITNPTPAAVTVDGLQLLRGDDGLTLAGPTGPTTIAPGDSLTATLSLSSAQPTNLDAPPEAVELDVTDAGQQSHLSLTVTGEVGAPASSTSLPALDLGTACLGETVAGTVVLANTGTATLGVQAPTIGSAFSIAFTDPVGYPAALAPGSAATITVSTADATTLGIASGTLAWSDDVPQDYAVPVTVTYIAQGAAVSPYTMAFGTVGVGIVSQPAVITLENCDATPRTVDIADVAAVSGTADAWSIQPHGAGQVLAPHAQLRVAVTFAPHYADPYNASLQISIDGQASTIQLLGQGSGDPRDRTFYGCGCQGSGGGAAGALPLAGLAAVLVSRRRRRGSS